MDGVNKTLYIPLYGKSCMSKRGLFLQDQWAEKIWETEQFLLKGKAKSKWLAFYMGIRAAVFDDWVKEKMAEQTDGVVLHLGCGMDSRAMRVGTQKHKWYDVDFPEVIGERKRYFTETAEYRMLPADVRQKDWLEQIPERKTGIVVMEGISMYLTAEQLQGLMENLCGHFEQVFLLMDCYTELAARMSRYKNPVREVGVTCVYGMDDPRTIQTDTLRFVKEQEMTPARYVDKLQGMERKIFGMLYAGGFSQKLYRLYEYWK